MDILQGQETIHRNAGNRISGTFTASGVLKNNEGERTKTVFSITDGKFENLPVIVHTVENFEDGWTDPSI